MASTRGGLISVWPCASEDSESTLREADFLATLPMYDPGMLASWYRRRYGSVRLQAVKTYLFIGGKDFSALYSSFGATGSF